MSEETRVVFSSFYTGNTGLELYASGTAAQLVALYHLTCRESNCAGLFALSDASICENTGLSMESVASARRLLGDLHFVERSGRWVWVRNMLLAQTLGSANPQDGKVIAAAKAYQFAKGAAPELAAKYRHYLHEIVPAACGIAAYPSKCPVGADGKVPEYWYVDSGSANVGEHRAYPADWAPFATRAWDGATFDKLRAFGPEYLLLAIYLIRPPGGHVTGIYRTNLPTILSHVRIEGSDFPSGGPYDNFEAKLMKLRLMLSRLRDVDFCDFDEQTGTMFVHNALSFHMTGTGSGQINVKDNKYKGVVKHVKAIGKTRLYEAIRARYPVVFTGEQDHKQAELFGAGGSGKKGAHKAPNRPPLQAPHRGAPQAPSSTPQRAAPPAPIQGATSGAAHGGPLEPRENLSKNLNRTLSPQTPQGEQQAPSDEGARETLPSGNEKLVMFPGTMPAIEVEVTPPDDQIPYVEIAQLWNDAALKGTPSNRKLIPVRFLSKKTISNIRRVWLRRPAYGSLAHFELLFFTVTHNKFLNGDDQKAHRFKNVGTTFEWVVDPENAAAIVEEKQYLAQQMPFDDELLTQSRQMSLGAS